MNELPSIFFGWIATVVTSWCLGKILLRGLSIRLYRQEENVFAFVVGSACLSLLVFALAAVHLANRGTFIALMVLTVGAAIWRQIFRPAGLRLPAMPATWQLLFWAVYVPFAVVYLVNALAPEVSPDGSTYHLGLVARYLRDGGFSRITTDFHASLPQGFEMLFLFAFAWGRHSAAALVHCTYLLTLPLVTLAYGRRVGLPAVGVAGGLLVFTSPVAAIDGTSAYNDVAVACLLFSIFALLQVWTDEPSPNLLIPVGILAGFAFAIKYTAFLALPYALGFAGFHLYRRRKDLTRALLVTAMCGSLFVLPTLVKNWLVVRNPVSPFLNRMFPNPYVHVAFEDQVKKDMRRYGQVESWRQVPLEVTVLGGKLSGLLGPVFLLAPLCLLALNHRTGRQLVFAALVFALPYPANIGTRFLLPSAVFIAPAIALVASRFPGAAQVLLLVHAVTTWPAVVDQYCTSYAWRLPPLPARAAFRLETEPAYLAALLDGYDIARLIDRWVPEGAKVYSFSPVREAYCRREVMVSYYGALNERLRDGLNAVLLPELQPTAGLVFHTAPQLVHRIRIVQTAEGKPDQPSITELHVLTPKGELLRSSTWKLGADPFPWDVGLAFDNNPATRWSAWQPEFPGTYVEVDFGQEQEIDGVRLECSRGDQWGVRYELRGQGTDGQWRLLARVPERVALPTPPNLRALAIEQLKAHGMRYLLVRDMDYEASDFKENTSVWGLERVAAGGGAVLYRLK